MPKDLRIRDDLVQKLGVSQDSGVDCVQLLLVSEVCEQLLISMGKRVEVLPAAIVPSKLRKGFLSDGTLRKTE